MREDRRVCLALWAALTVCLSGCAAKPSKFSQNRATAKNTAVAVAIQNGFTIQWIRSTPESKNLSVEIQGCTAETLQALAAVSMDFEQWARIVAVYVAPNAAQGGTNLPPVLGHYQVLNDRLRFDPQFPVEPGVTYRVELQTQNLPKFAAPKIPMVTAWFRLAEPARISKTFVEHVYPSPNKLPENLLKFYIHFSGPMSRGGIYEHIHLLDETGRPVELPFLEINEELWNPELTRLTLFIDPGRIKRGVKPLEEVGPAIVAGKRYTLMIDQDFRDSDGNPLKSAFRKVFAATPPDRVPPDPAHWIIKAPRAGTREQLEVRFTEPMDHALAQRLLWVMTPDHQRLAGQTALPDGEKTWRFAPNATWNRGQYRLVANNLLEDLAGNSLGRPFEVDVFERVQEKILDETVALPFEVRAR